MTDVCTNSARPVTLKRSRPNPIFQEWLEELHQEAKQKKCKLEHQLSEALTSLSKYPLPLNSGAECRILKGFDSRLCDFIEQRLKTHNIQDNGVQLVPNKSNGVTESGLALSKYKHLMPNKSNEVNKSDLAISKYKNYLKELLSYSLILISLKQLWIDGNENVPIDMLLSHASKEFSELNKKLATCKTKSKFPKTFRPFKELVEVDPSTDNYFLTNTGFSEACYIEHLLNDYKNNVSTASQTDAALPTTHIETCDLTNECTTKEDTSGFEMESGSFVIILLIDKNETSGLSNKNDKTVAQFKKYSDLKHEYRSLKVGDFAWIARHKVQSDREVVLPYIVERKRLDDLSASIKDGRFHEQKFRLRRCGLNNVIYLVENYASKKYTGLPVQTLMQALANTRVQDGFKVHITDSLINSVRFLAMMTKRLTFEYEDKTIKCRNAEADGDMHMTFDFFNKMSVKNKPLTVTETFIKLLLQLKGLSVEKALAITNVYKTPKSLINAYKYLDREEGETLLANLKYGESSRKVGPVVSKSLYQLFSSFDIS